MLLPYETRAYRGWCDEAGRGCWVRGIRAAVIFRKILRMRILNDSKQLSEKKRCKLRPVIEA